MPGTISHGSYTIPFDEDIFQMYFEDEPDLVMNAMLTSGAMVEDARIADLIRDGGNVYTVPFYSNLANDADQNYDGQTNIELSTMGGSYQSGAVYGRAHAWYADDFAADFTAANPLAAMASRSAKYWQNKRQARMIGIVEGALGVAALASHTITDTGVTPTTLSDAAQQVWGANKGMVRLAVMHSAIAQKFENMERVEYLKYTDPNGITRELPIYQINGLTVVIDDGVPVTPASGSGESATPATYTTYLFGEGALRHASAPVSRPVFFGREELTRGGYDFFGNKFRETIHPNGFSYTLPKVSGKAVVSPDDAQLAATANWSLAYSDAKAIPIAKIVTPAAIKA